MLGTRGSNIVLARGLDAHHGLGYLYRETEKPCLNMEKSQFVGHSVGSLSLTTMCKQLSIYLPI